MSQLAPDYSPSQFKKLGLEIAGCRWWRFAPEIQEQKYHRAFGVCPKTSSDMWRAMRNSDDPDIHLPANTEPKYLLLLHRFLWTYDTEEELGRFFQIGSPMTTRKWIRYMAPRVQLLLKHKMGNLEDADDGLVFMLSIDATHCPIWEQRPFSTKWSSHKLGGKPGVNYELGITIYNPRLVWVNGPTPAGAYNDITVFRNMLMGVMREKLPGRRLIGDAGYSGEPAIISTKNEFDPQELSEFKNRVMARHESFNQRLKCFQVLTKPFRHGVRVHGICFRAVCVHVIFQMENGIGLLFDPYP